MLFFPSLIWASESMVSTTHVPHETKDCEANWVDDHQRKCCFQCLHMYHTILKDKGLYQLTSTFGIRFWSLSGFNPMVSTAMSCCRISHNIRKSETHHESLRLAGFAFLAAALHLAFGSGATAASGAGVRRGILGGGVSRDSSASLFLKYFFCNLHQERLHD